jgi:ribonuclease III
LKNINRLTERLGYTFTNPAHLRTALTHRSASSQHNERLEFLGDSLLNTVITKTLYHRFADENEGQLSRLRAHLVKGDMLAQIAAEIQLGDFLFLGPGELKTGGFRRSSILADALEAIFAAIFLDGGFDACEAVILDLYKTRLEDDLHSLNTKDAKTQLQEYLQAHKKPLPQYILVEAVETEADTHFSVICKIDHIQTSGTGQTRRKAEQEAALLSLNLLKESESGR